MNKKQDIERKTKKNFFFGFTPVLIIALFVFPSKNPAENAEVNEGNGGFIQTIGDVQITNLNDNLADTWWQFSFVHLTDIHIGEGYEDYGTYGYNDSPPTGDVGYSAQRLREAVNWINNNKYNYDIRFVIITGDLTDSGEKSEFYKAKEILDALTIPYIPLIGNHDIWPYTSSLEASYPYGDEYFKNIFASHFDYLQDTLPGWSNGTRLTRTWNPEAGCYSYFQNFAFSYAGYLFMCGDFGTRQHAPFGEPGTSPEADLMDFSGGTWPWLKNYMASYNYKAADNVLIFAHFPLTKDPWNAIASFSYGEYNTITSYLNNNSYKYYTGLWCAGHMHRNYVYNVKTLLFSTVCPGVETDANKEDSGHIRVIKIYGKTSVPDPEGVVLYEHSNYSGKGEFFPYHDSDLRGNMLGNDKASSHRIMGSVSLYLYKDINYGGGSKYFYYDVPNYTTYGINDWVSSLKVYW